MLPFVYRGPGHANELSKLRRRNPQTPALRDDALCAVADLCGLGFYRCGSGFLAHATRKSIDFGLERGGVTLQVGDIFSGSSAK